MKSLARCYVWRSKIDQDIESIDRSCKTCQLNRSSPPKSPLHHWEYPNRPWARLHIVVDAHSKWIEAHPVTSTSSNTTIRVLQNIRATHGIPEHLVSDNNSGFTSQEFQTLLAKNGVKHSITSPYHPSSNGLAKNAIQTVKQGISKLEGSISFHISRFLLSYWTTPQTSTGLSPAEVLMGRRLRTRLDLIRPDAAKKVVEKQDKLKKQYEPRKFEPEDKLYAICYSGQGGWISVTEIQQTGPVS